MFENLDNNREGAPLSYYQILGVNPNASEEDIKRAFKKEALLCHPDKFALSTPEEQQAATVKFQILNGAYKVLSDPGKRAHYDRHGRAPDGNPSGPYEQTEKPWENARKDTYGIPIMKGTDMKLYFDIVTGAALHFTVSYPIGDPRLEGPSIDYIRGKYNHPLFGKEQKPQSPWPAVPTREQFGELYLQKGGENAPPYYLPNTETAFTWKENPTGEHGYYSVYYEDKRKPSFFSFLFKERIIENYQRFSHPKGLPKIRTGIRILNHEGKPISMSKDDLDKFFKGKNRNPFYHAHHYVIDPKTGNAFWHVGGEPLGFAEIGIEKCKYDYPSSIGEQRAVHIIFGKQFVRGGQTEPSKQPGEFFILGHMVDGHPFFLKKVVPWKK